MLSLFLCPDEGYCVYKAKKTIDKENPNLESFNFSKYDGYQNDLLDVINDCSSISFFSTNKVILVTNCYFLSDEKSKEFQSKDSLEAFSLYIKNPNPMTNLYLCGSKLGNSTFAKTVSKYFTVHKIDEIDANSLAIEAIDYCKKRNCILEKDAALELVDRVSLNWNMLINFMDKICLYASNISLKEIDLLIPKKIEDNVFAITNFLMNGDSLKALSSYRDLKFNGYFPFSILNILFSQFSFMSQVKYLSDLNFSDELIASKLNCSKGRVYMNRRTLYNISYNSLVNILADLHDIEMNSKFESDDINFGLELFLLKFKDKYLN